MSDDVRGQRDHRRNQGRVGGNAGLTEGQNNNQVNGDTKIRP